jgi:hypothetical protein
MQSCGLAGRVAGRSCGCWPRPYGGLVSIGVVFETHATTGDNESGRATGGCPAGFSGQGREQARQLGRRRADDGISAVVTSDLARAVETVSIAFAGHLSRCCATGGCANARTGPATACWPSEHALPHSTIAITAAQRACQRA